MKKYMKPVMTVTVMDAYIKGMLCVSTFNTLTDNPTVEISTDPFDGEFSEKNDDDFNAW